MKIILLQEAIAAGPFLLIGLIVSLLIVGLIFFLGSKVLEVKRSIKTAQENNDEKQLKQKRTKYVFFLLVIFTLAVWIIGIIVKFSNITFG